MLSGGLDSRTLAGLLERDGYGIRTAITMGVPGEIEFDCAANVARALEIPHTSVPSEPGRYLEDALRLIHFEGLGSNWLAFDFDQARPVMRELGVVVVNGFLGDAMLGGSHIGWARDVQTGEINFDALFGRINRYGFPPETVRALLRPEFRGDGVEEELQELRALYEDLPGLDYHKPWQFDIMHRQRLMIGPNNWRLSFGSWPVSPFTQKRVHRLAARLPLKLFEKRRFQRMILEEYFPRLAKLPVDSNLFRTDPVVSGPLDRIASRLRARRYRWQKLRTGREPRYYNRVFDFDGEGFRAIRRRAAPILDVLDDVFDPDVLRRLLPDPEESRSYSDAFADSAGFKLILGLALLRHELTLPAREVRDTSTRG
jgi:asparagine synthase (glutamine-hydrolysing)